FVIAVQEVDRQPVARLDPLPRPGELGRGGIAEGALPEADVADRNIEVAREPRELLGRPVQGIAELRGRVEAPTVEDCDPGADIPDRDREVDRILTNLRDAAPAFDDEPLLVDEADLLRRIIELRRE